MKRSMFPRTIFAVILISLFIAIQIVSGSVSQIQASSPSQAPIQPGNSDEVLARAAYWAERREGISPEKLQNAYARAVALPQANAAADRRERLASL